MTQVQLGEQLSISTSSLEKIESGHRDVSMATLREAAAVMGIPYEWFTIDDVTKRFLSDTEAMAIVRLERTFNARLDALAARIESAQKGAIPPAADPSQPPPSDPRPLQARDDPRRKRLAS